MWLFFFFLCERPDRFVFSVLTPVVFFTPGSYTFVYVFFASPVLRVHLDSTCLWKLTAARVLFLRRRKTTPPAAPSVRTHTHIYMSTVRPLVYLSYYIPRADKRRLDRDKADRSRASGSPCEDNWVRRYDGKSLLMRNTINLSSRYIILYTCASPRSLCVSHILLTPSKNNIGRLDAIQFHNFINSFWVPNYF